MIDAAVPYTPGPWTCDAYGNLTAIGAYRIARIETSDPYGRALPFRGNAALIAVAPELLAVVEAAEKWAMLNIAGQSVPWLDDATAAISAAKGEK